MEKLYLFIPKKTLILIAILVLIIIGLAAMLLLKQQAPTLQPTPPVISQIPTPLIPIQKTVIGKTKPKDIEKIYQIQDKQLMTNGDLKYSISSKIDAKPNQILFRNNLAAFERIVIVGDRSLADSSKLSDKIIKFGSAEAVKKGSKFYGYHMDTYIYPSKGLAFIANTNADEIYEIQIFAPTSLDNYLSDFGDDIVGEVKEIIEEPF